MEHKMISTNLAHLTITADGKFRQQALRDHNRNVGRYAAECMSYTGLANCGMLCGLLHDGKGTQKYQEYLRSCAAYDAYDLGLTDKPALPKPERGSVNHTFAGVIYLLDRYHGKNSVLADYTSEILSCAIGSHHGLFDCLSINGQNGFIKRVEKADREDIQYEEARLSFENEISSANELDRLFQKSKEEIEKLMRKIAVSNSENGEVDSDYINMGLALTSRLLTSALMYADRRDTAEFADQTEYADIPADWDRDIQDYEKQYSQLQSGGTFESMPINLARKSISEQCRQFAEKPGAIYRLNVPTGGGKTLSSLRYALYHARAYGKKKIIYVIPLLTIIDQNAAEIEKYLPQEMVLEHHSDVMKENMSDDELHRYDLMRDRWTAPVVITTLVQILEILFGDKSGCIARMRALCNAVIIFDEVQSVPMHSLALFNSALNFLAEFCRTTVILCSATQPEFDRLKKYPLHVTHTPMVSLTAKQIEPFKRQKYHDLIKEPKTLEEIADFALSILDNQNPVMIVCNTRTEAKELYRQLNGRGGEDLQIAHLSASMCKAHRKTVLREINAKLHAIQTGEEQQPFILVTTQLVEAGVNLSFRSVIRILAGNDNLVQTGGRCNRSNEYGAGDVYLLKLTGEEQQLRNLPEIRMAQDAMADNIFRHLSFEPEDSQFIEDYYLALFTNIEEQKKSEYLFQYRDGKTYALAGLLSGNLKAGDKTYKLHQPFKTAAQEYKVFPENTYPVLVPYKEDGKKLIESMRAIDRAGRIISKTLLRQAGDYIVQVYDWQKRKLGEKSMLESLADDQIFILSEVAYDERYGLNTDAEWTMEDMIY